MAVFTQVTEQEAHALLAQYNIGELSALVPIAEGSENTNYKLEVIQVGKTTPYILTLFEARVNPKDVPFYVSAMQWVAERGLSSPHVQVQKNGEAVAVLKNKLAIVVSFLPGKDLPAEALTLAHVSAFGAWLGQFHLLSKDCPHIRVNDFGVVHWEGLIARVSPEIDALIPDFHRRMIYEAEVIAGNWVKDAPRGLIHADIFPDNVFFDGVRVSGVIDWFFACTDALVLDLAIAINSWCFVAHDNAGQKEWRLDEARMQALLDAYETVRPLNKSEKTLLPLALRGAALRFLLTRSFDHVARPDVAAALGKNPLEYWQKLTHWQKLAPRNCG